VEEQRKRVISLRASLDERMKAQMRQKKQAFASRIAHLDALSPLKVMQRGYSLVYKGDELIKSVEQIACEDKLMVRLNDGSVTASVERIEREEKQNGSQKNGTRD
jgi:exodeoxyribonuclease VII large subunit